MYRCFNVLLFVFVFISCKNNQALLSKKAILVEPKTTACLIYDNIVFYDSYAASTKDSVPPNIIKINNTRYAKKLTKADLAKISDNLTMNITVHALCDNYDRIGGVYLSFVNKGENFDVNKVVTSQEIARFITPFMDKNAELKTVPYSFQIDNIAKLLNNVALNTSFDFWLEFEVFGVPYAANKEVEGCGGRNDVFGGTLELVSTDKTYSNDNEAYIKIYSKESLNNYNNTDVASQTIKINKFDVTKPIKDAKLYVITSNHGANRGGEEYVRREHFIYFDNNLVSSYTPGGLSCEPFRKYNTQRNGIYGKEPREDSKWASWNNWCPGNKFPIRIFDLGNLSVGSHEFKIDVPDAEFKDKQGDIPLSVYIQGIQ